MEWPGSGVENVDALQISDRTPDDLIIDDGLDDEGDALPRNGRPPEYG